MTVKITTFDPTNGSTGQITLRAGQVKAYRERTGLIVTSSKPVTVRA